MNAVSTKVNIDEGFLAALSKGNVTAFRAFYDACKNNIFNTVMVYLQDEQEATEITQQVFVRLWEKRSLLVEVEKWQDYIFTITKNLVFDHLKQLGRQAELLVRYRKQIINSADNNAEETVNEKSIMQLWLSIVHKLPAQQQQVYTMVEQRGLSLDEASGKLSIEKATVKKHLELARRFVRAALKKALLEQPVSSGINQSFLQIFF
ncbi:MAG: sigma-70 family RNA polymerase sigma factor [Chitinophagaceae bacterium]|nr:sigma-70 family RNA polymerase sigma factor [Chitinophagaceae bacterium]